MIQITPVEASALNQLLAVIAASDDRIVSASQRIGVVAEQTVSEMRQQVERLMAEQEALQKKLIETTSQTKQIELALGAQTRVVAERVGLEKALYEETRQRILKANRAICNYTTGKEKVKEGDVDALLCARHGVNLVYDLRRWMVMRGEMVKMQDGRWAITTVFCYFCHVRRAWLEEYFYPGKNSALAQPLWKTEVTEEAVLRDAEVNRMKTRYVSVPPFAPFPVNPVEWYMRQEQDFQEEELPFFGPEKPTVEERLTVLQLEWDQPLPIESLPEPSAPLPLVLAVGDPLLGQLMQSSSDLMGQVSKTEKTAQTAILQMRHQLALLAFRNHTLTGMLAEAERELARAMGASVQVETASLPEKMEKAKKLWVEAVIQEDEKFAAEKKRSPCVQFIDCLGAFFDFEIQKAIEALDRLIQDIAKDGRFLEEEKKNLTAHFEKIKKNWKRLNI